MDSISPEAAKALNEQIRQLAKLLPGGIDHRYGFSCECGCGETVPCAAADYDREGGAWADGHKPT